MKDNGITSGVEIPFPEGSTLISTTNSKGQITYSNASFTQISGFSNEELIGSSHNLVRHRFMPEAAFWQLWTNINSHTTWRGIVLNRAKNGDEYWVDAFVAPIVENGAIKEIQSVRQKPCKQAISRAKSVYEQINANKKTSFDSGLSINHKAGIALVSTGLLCGAGAYAAGLIDLSGVIVVAGASLISAGVSNLVNRPYKNMVDEAKKIVDDPLAQYIYTGRKDETGSVLYALSYLKAKATAVADRIADTSQNISTNTDALNTSSENASACISEQFQATDTISAAANEMSITSEEVSKNAKNASEGLLLTKEIAESIAGHNKETLREIHALDHNLEIVGGLTKELSASTKDIHEILTQISSVAEQTNLLALNASIEAARAGENGRGFAVVADEVRTLASRTSMATETIDSLLKKLEKTSTTTSMQVNSSKEIASNVVGRSDDFDRRLEEVISVVDTVTDQGSGVAAATEQQKTAIEELVNSLQSIRDQSATIREGSNANQENCWAVNGLVADLQSLAKSLCRV